MIQVLPAFFFLVPNSSRMKSRSLDILLIFFDISFSSRDRSARSCIAFSVFRRKKSRIVFNVGPSVFIETIHSLNGHFSQFLEHLELFLGILPLFFCVQSIEIATIHRIRGNQTARSKGFPSEACQKTIHLFSVPVTSFRECVKYYIKNNFISSKAAHVWPPGNYANAQ